MKKTLLAAVAAVVVLGAPALAMDMMKMVPMDATMMCRPAMKTEKPQAMMGAKGMECKSMAGMSMPNTKGKTAAQTDKMWRDWIQQAMLVPSATGTTGGNG
jgi:hypothetical protein